jgi:hypothetical protein
VDFEKYFGFILISRSVDRKGSQVKQFSSALQYAEQFTQEPAAWNLIKI